MMKHKGYKENTKVKQGGAVYAKIEEMRQSQAPCPKGNAKENSKYIISGVLTILRAWRMATPRKCKTSIRRNCNAYEKHLNEKSTVIIANLCQKLPRIFQATAKGS